MNASYVNINTNILLAKDKDRVFEVLAKKLLTYGITFSSTYNIQGKYENIKETLNFISEKLVFIIGDANYVRNNALKLMFSKYLKTLTYKDNKISNCVINFFKNFNLNLKNEVELEAIIPVGATPICSDLSEYNGFWIKNLDKVYLFLPNDLESINVLMYQIEDVMLSIGSSLYKINIIKTFGITDKDLLILIKDKLTNNDFQLTTYANNLDITLTIRYMASLDESYIREFISNIYSKLNKYIYADEDVSMFKVVYDLLKLTKKTLCVAESSSYGLITNEFLKSNSDAGKYFANSIFFVNDKSINNILQINPSIIAQYGLVSVESTYEISVEMLEKYKSDYIICTCGDTKFSNNNFDSIKCFIAVGDTEGIHVYKNNFAGNREDILQNIAKSAMFYLIKKIKQKDFLNQNIV